MRSHLFDLDFVEDAGAVYEVLLSVAFEHFVAEGVRLQEFGWVLDCVQCQGDRYLIRVFEELTVFVNQVDF